MLKLKVIACDVLNREISFLASQSKNYIDVTYLNQGLHNTPDKLREILQAEIDKVKFPYNYYNTCRTMIILFWPMVCAAMVLWELKAEMFLW